MLDVDTVVATKTGAYTSRLLRSGDMKQCLLPKTSPPTRFGFTCPVHKLIDPTESSIY